MQFLQLLAPSSDVSVETFLSPYQKPTSIVRLTATQGVRSVHWFNEFEDICLPIGEVTSDTFTPFGPSYAAWVKGMKEKEEWQEKRKIEAAIGRLSLYYGDSETKKTP